MILKLCVKDFIVKYIYMYYSKILILFDRFWFFLWEVIIKCYFFGNYFNCEYICFLFVEKEKKMLVFDEKEEFVLFLFLC